MKRVLFSTTAIVALAIVSQAALAADMPVRKPMPPQGQVMAPPPVFNWSGFYVGAHAGYGWGTSRFSAPAAGTGNFNVDGWLFGGLAGVNYQAGQTVFGVEADINWSDFSGGAACGATSCNTDVPWFGTLRGRLGYAADRFMPYITGGLAYGKVEANVPGVGTDSATRIGWTAGVGAEYAFAPNMSWKTEYLYVDLGDFNCTSCGAPVPNVDFTSHIVRTGLNIRF
jgi:outer membrane immunogenic protein